MLELMTRVPPLGRGAPKNVQVEGNMPGIGSLLNPGKNWGKHIAEIYRIYASLLSKCFNLCVIAV